MYCTYIGGKLLVGGIRPMTRITRRGPDGVYDDRGIGMG